MFFKKQKKITESNTKTKQSDNLSEYKLGSSIEINVNILKQIFKDDDTFMVRYFENQYSADIKCCILFIDGMINNEIVNENVIQPVVQSTELKYNEDLIDCLQNKILISNCLEKSANVYDLVNAIVRGDTVLFLDGAVNSLIINTKGWSHRQINEPQNERVNRGPREGFSEPLILNLTMIRRKLETPNLKFKFMTIGKQSQTKICICFIDGIVNYKILNELYKRLNDIDIDSVLGSGYLQELIQDSPFSPLYTIGITERPDVVAGKILEGRVAIIVDGTPVVLTLPCIFAEAFQTTEDYFLNFYMASFSRLLRIIGFLVSISIPAIYVAIVTFHQETIPTPLLLSISTARQGIPFPTIVELILLLIVFEVLVESGLRMPLYIGQTLSIVGAMVLGTASVEAKLISPSIIIIVSIAALTGLMTPRTRSVAVFMRMTLVLLSSFLGLYGYLFGMMGFLLHLCELRSFGVPYMLQLTSLDPSDLKDTAIRAPWWYMRHRPKLITHNKVRQKSGVKKHES